MSNRPTFDPEPDPSAPEADKPAETNDPLLVSTRREYRMRIQHIRLFGFLVWAGLVLSVLLICGYLALIHWRLSPGGEQGVGVVFYVFAHAASSLLVLRTIMLLVRVQQWLTKLRDDSLQKVPLDSLVPTMLGTQARTIQRQLFDFDNGPLEQLRIWGLVTFSLALLTVIWIY